MHDVRVPLDEHQPVHLDGPKLAHSAHVVAAQVHQHHVLGALLLVVEHLVGHRLVFLFSSPARAGSGNRPVLHLALVHAHQQLRRRSGQLHYCGWF